MFKGIVFLVKFCWRSNKKYILVLFAWKIIASIIPLINIVMPKFIIDELIGSRQLDHLLLYVSILLATNFVGSMSVQFLISQTLIQRTICYNHFQIYLSRIMVQADYMNLENPDFLNAREKAFKFLYGDGWGFATVLDRAVDIIGKIGTFIGVIMIVFHLSPWLIIIFTALVLFNGWLESRNKLQLIKWDLERTPLERRNQYISDVMTDYSYGKDLRIYNSKEWMIDIYKDQLKQLRMYYQKSAWKNLQTTAFALTANLMQQIVSYAFIIYNVLTNLITIGDFSMYLGAVNTFSSAMNDVTSSIVDIRRFSEYYDALEDFISVPQSMREGKCLPLVQSEHNMIEFKNVSFRYPGQNGYALKNVSLLIQKGDKLAVVGENGAGKSTFIKLLLRLYDPSEGEIYFNNINIKDIDYDEYMKLFSVVFQDYKIMATSILENVTMKESVETDKEKVKYILNEVGLKRKINSLKNGVDTLISKMFDIDGIELSGGESQKLVLGRALYKNASFVILDEPTASLDPRSEYEMYQLFNQLSVDKTAVFISHRLASTQFCDKIAYFLNGEIVEYGCHQSLLQKNGLYSELFNMQAKYYTGEPNVLR